MRSGDAMLYQCVPQQFETAWRCSRCHEGAITRYPPAATCDRIWSTILTWHAELSPECDKDGRCLVLETRVPSAT